MAYCFVVVVNCLFVKPPPSLGLAGKLMCISKPEEKVMFAGPGGCHGLISCGFEGSVG